MKQKYTFITALLILFAAILIGCNNGNAEENAETAAENIPPVIETTRVVSAEAFVVPIQEVDVAFESSGRVVELLVSEGDQVEAGQVLGRLNDADAKAAVAVAESNLAQAEANLASVKAGPTAEQIEVAEAAVVQAEASLAQVLVGPRDEEIATAQARVDTLQAQLNQTLSGNRDETILASLASVRQAEIALADAQREYDKIAYAADSDQAQPIVTALQSATLSYEAAMAQHEALVNGATSQEVGVVRAQLAEGEAALAQAKAGPTAEQIAIAQAGVIQAEAALKQAMAGATEEQIAVAEAGVLQAEAAIEQARLALDKLVIATPFGGTIVSLDLEEGQIVSVGSPVMSIANVDTWEIETDDLTEIDVVKVQIGQPVDISFDALPNEDDAFSGTVKAIKPKSETKAGDVTYTVVVDLDQNDDPRIRWGMTAFVEIDVE